MKVLLLDGEVFPLEVVLRLQAAIREFSRNAARREQTVTQPFPFSRTRSLAQM